MKNRQFWPGVLFCVLAPLIGIFNNSNRHHPIGSGRMLLSWAVIATFLYAVWLFNQYVIHKLSAPRPFIKALYYLVINALAVSLFVLTDYYLIPSGFQIGYSTPWLLFVMRIGIAVVIIIIIQNMVRSLQQKEMMQRQNQQLQNENLASRFEILKQQVNPHFLFNSLSTLRTMVRAGDNNAETFIIKLSDVYRQLLTKRETVSATVEEELEFLDSFVFMLKARFENLLKVDIEIPASSLQCNLPVFSLQLLVENCIKHNVISAAKPLSIKIFQSDKSSVCVENNVQLKTSADESKGIGLNNLRKRYELLGVENGVTVYQTIEKFSVSLKFL